MKKLFLSLFVLFLTAGFSVYGQAAEEFYAAGKANYEKKAYSEAIQDFDKALEVYPEYLMSFYYRGLSSYALGKFAEAVSDFDDAIEIRPDMAELYYHRALAQKAAGNKEEATSDFSAASHLAPENEDYLFSAAENASANGDHVSAVIAYGKLADMSGKYSEASAKRREAFKNLDKEGLAYLTEISPVTAAASGLSGRPDDPNTKEVKAYLAEHKFGSVEEARAYYYDLMGKKGFEAGKKKALLGDLRKKALLDLYGPSPFKEDIDDMKSLLNNHTWLRPEGMDYYFDMIENSPYWFTGNIQRKNIYYYYKIMRSKRYSYYQLQIYAVRNKESVMVFSSQIELKEDSLKREALVNEAVNKGYMWKVSPKDYLKAAYLLPAKKQAPDSLAADSLRAEIVKEIPAEIAPEDRLSFETGGRMAEKADPSHGFSDSEYKKFITIKEEDAEQPNALIRALVHRLILDYPGVFSL